MALRNAPVAIRPTSGSSPRIVSPDQQVKSTACSTCTRRKVKCDRTQPCSTCRTGGFVCEYPERNPRKRKRKDIEDLQERLDRYETLLKDNGLLSKQDTVPEQTQRRLSNKHLENSAPSNGVFLSGSAPGQTRYVESNVWQDLGDHIHPSSDNEDESDSAPLPRTTSAQAGFYLQIDLISAGLFGASPPSYSLTYLHPQPELANKLWQMYLRNINPIVKVSHGPSTGLLVESAACDVEGLSKETLCLLFSIYHFAITSMTDSERRDIVGESWKEVHKSYHDATRLLLIGCNLYQTTSLTVLQAYSLLLVSVRFDYNPHTFWILSGIAMRLAQRMGLHSQDERQLAPFDVQMRRRIWWTVLLTDSFAAQQAGTTVSTIPLDAWNAPQPLNVDDEDIWPGMIQPPVEKRGATSMMMFLIRLEISVYRMKLGQTADWKDSQQRDAAFQSLEDRIETTYLRYCDVTDPSHYLVLVGSRAALLNARLRSRLSRLKAGDTIAIDSKETFKLALKLLDYDAAMRSSLIISRYTWQWQSFFSWEPLIFTLKELCQATPPEGDANAWEKIEKVVVGHPNILELNRPIEVAIGRLTLRAWELSQRRSSVAMLEPGFISYLRGSLQRRKDSTKNTLDTATLQRDSEVMAATQVPSAMPEFDTEGTIRWENFDGDIDWSFWDELMRSPEIGHVGS